MTTPTIEEQLEHLRKPGSPTATDVHLLLDEDTIDRPLDPFVIRSWAHSDHYKFHLSHYLHDQSYEEVLSECRRALRERAWREWHAELAWYDHVSGEQFAHIGDKTLKIDIDCDGHWEVFIDDTKIVSLGFYSLYSEEAEIAASRAAYDHLFPEGGE